MPLWAGAILFAHFCLLGLLCVYGAHRFYLSGWAFRSRPEPQAAMRPVHTHPRVTVQLPVYNERFVVERLIDAAAALDYPRERLQIQVLDDSSDDTRELAQTRVQHHRERGVDIEYLHRGERRGYKAGALAAGLECAKGELIAIFDADFVPVPDTLLRTVGEFADAGVGMVQLRWGHLNRDYSSLTEVQAILLDAHFAVEQRWRWRQGHFFNFNGTAGLWRAQAIRHAGGWHSDTLTEDLDLSYRAQLRGWRFVLLHDCVCPGELPVSLRAFRTQQHRWAKGATQVLLKLLGQVWRAPLPFATKLEASFHLSSNVAYLVMVADCLLFLIPSIIIRNAFDWGGTLWVDLPLFMFATLSHLAFFVAGQHAIGGGLRAALRRILLVLPYGIGLAVNNASAVVEALLRRDSAFLRTPKLGTHARRAGAAPRNAYPALAGGGEGFELVLGLLYAGFTLWCAQQELWLALPFLLLLCSGFLHSALRGWQERSGAVAA